jgi:uncharacterized membrane-anchored protein
MSKLPAITAVFWIMKIAATTLGETGGDLVAQTLNVGYLVSSVLFVGLFLVSLVAQLRAKKYHPALFWAVIVTTSTAGTTISDFMNRTAGLGYAAGATVLIACLVIVFIVWRLSGTTLKVEEINTFRGEVLYWVATLISNTLGTSTGDYLAHDAGIGFQTSTLVITAALLVIVAAHYFTPISGTLLFWVAYVLTRPFGANAGNTLSKTPEEGGLGLGTFGASAILAAVLVGLVVYQIVQQHRRKTARSLPEHRGAPALETTADPRPGLEPQ